MAAAIVLAGMGTLGAAVEASAQIAPRIIGGGPAQVTLPVQAPANTNRPKPATRPAQTRLPTPIASEFYTGQRGVTLDAPVVPRALNTVQPVRVADGIGIENIAPVRISATGNIQNRPPMRIDGVADVPSPPPPLSTPPAAPPSPPAGPDDSGAGIQTTSAGPNTTAFNTVSTTDFNTTTNGINVLAQAAYDNAEVDFTPGTAADVVELFANEAIINWTTFNAGSAGNDVTFLGNGSNLEFTSALSDYTVLNRVFTPGFDSAIRIDGNITSTVLSGAVTGGNVWFYSAGGIIVGPGASIDVGSLLLTTSQLDSIDAGGSQMNFLGVSNPASAIVIENGASISANQTNSYVALVAPRIRQQGNVSVNGSAAYVAAEEAQLTINNGLFDISVGLGSEDANGIVHLGTTGGAASQATVDGDGDIVNADRHAIYMVAVPKNNAMTMLVGGTVGFDAATMASRTDNGTIILSAGAGVSTDGVLNNPGITIESSTSPSGGSIAIENATFTSDTEVYASDTVDLTQRGLNPQTLEYSRLSSGGDARGDYDINVTADSALLIGVADNSTIDIAGDLNLRAGFHTAEGVTITLTASNLTNSAGGGPPPPPPPADGGQINIGGNLTIDASGFGRDDFATFRDNGGTGIGEDAAGGVVNLIVEDGGALTVGGNVTLDASGQGGKGENQNGESFGGVVNLSVSSGTLDVAGTVTLDASGVAAQFGKDTAGGPGLIGNSSFGGTVSVNLSGGQTNIGTLLLNASADGSTGSDSSVAQDASATAGTVSFNATGGTHTFGRLDLLAEAAPGGSFDASGSSVSGSAGRGVGSVSVSGTDTTVQVTDDLNIFVQTSGVIADSGRVVADISVTNTGTSGGLFIGDELNIDATAKDGSDTAPNTSGSVNLLVDNSTISFGRMRFDVTASPSGGFGFGSGQGMDFQAGDITLTARNGGILSGGSVDLEANASSTEFEGGIANAGNITLLADNGTITFTGTLSVGASGLGGGGINAADEAGTGQGGNILFSLVGAGGAMNFANIFANSDGAIFSDPEGGFFSGGVEGDGGEGIAGSVTFDLTGGTFAAGDVSVSSDGFGGAGGSSTNIPAGSSAVTPLIGTAVPGGAQSSALTLASVSNASQMGGALPKAGRGGDGTGGTVTFNVNGTNATMASLDVSADGIAGSGGFGDFQTGVSGGDGGDAFGGDATFNALSGSLTVTNTLSVTARGNNEFNRGNGGFGDGVAGGTGGDATGGTAIFNLTGTASIVAGAVGVDSSAFGGRGGSSFAAFDGSLTIPGDAGGDGGTGTAGSAEFNNTSGNITFSTLTVSANGDGGDGGDNGGISAGESNANGGAGGAGIGGIATINLNQDDISDPTYIIQALGTGGRGGAGLDSGVGGDATGGTARLNVNNVDVNVNALTISSSATAGEAGFVDGEGGNGGAGGSATGGISILDVNGVNGDFSSNNPTLVTADAQGGEGADGLGPQFFNGGGPQVAPGTGGTGGNGTAGQVQIIARDGASIDYFTDLGTTADGRAGAGGAGGSDFFGNSTGDGGDAGTATGGQIDVLAQTGGTITLRSTNLTSTFSASAFGALGGNGGTSSFGDLGALGANGDSLAGSVLISADGAGSTINLASELALIAQATNSDDSRTASVGANATGGTVTLSGTNGGAFTGGNQLLLDSSATAGSAFSSIGLATGGTAIIDLVGASAVFGDISAIASSTGGSGNQGLFSAGGSGGGSAGGTINISLDAASSLDANDIVVDATSTGGIGGNGDTGFGGGAGGDATGGDVTLDLAGNVANLSSVNLSAGATGGDAGTGGAGGNGGTGGAAQGGTIAFTLSGNGPVVPSLSDVVIDSRADGGAGGSGGSGDSVLAAGSGGAGGTATGGDVSFAISGAGATLDFDPAQFILGSEATGGAGGSGGGNFVGGVAGNGGTGGDGQGGAVIIQANSGTEITLTGGGSLPASLSSNGTGGAGGAGGGIDMISGGLAGNGGDGGTGTGGSPTLRAIGGTIFGADLELTAVGFGGNGGAGGDDGTVEIGARGNGGNGVGGSPLLEVLEGSPGILNFGAVTLLANGNAGSGLTAGSAIGGLVTINDASTDPLGVMRFGSLDVDASGTSSVAGGGFVMAGGSGTTAVNGSLSVNVAGDIVYNFDGDGQMTVGGTTLLDAGGNIIITHTNNTGNILSIDSTGRFDAQADGNFTSTDNAIISSDDTLSLDILGNITAHDLRGVGDVQVNAGQNVILNNATVSGPPSTFVGGAGVAVFSGLLVQAGLQTGGSIDEFDPNFSASITGDVTSTGFVNVNAGGNVTFVNGANVVSDNGITVFTGDDIIVQNGARIEAGANAAGPANTANPFASANNLTLAAGELINTGQLLGTGATPIASIIAAGDIAANDFAVVMTANAVDGLGGSIDASSVSIDIDNAPNAGDAQNNDAGLLSANCLQGSVCLGSISADNNISIGQNSNNDVISLTVEQASVAADDILITIRDNIVMGTDGIPTQLAATNQFLITSLAGDIDLRDAVVTSDQILIDAAGSLLGSGSLISTNDIGIDVGQDINLALIDTDGQLTTVAGVGGAAEFEYLVPGSINVGQYDLGNLNVRIVAGGDNSFGEININGTRGITLIASNTATGDVFLGTASGANDIDLIGDNVGFTDLSAARFLRLDAQAGGITGGSLTSVSLMELDGTFINVGNLNSGSTISAQATAGDVTVGTVVSTFVAGFSATGNVTTGDITSGGLGASLNADGNIVTGAINTSGGVADIRLTAGGSIDYTSINGSRLVNITGGAVTGGDVTGASQVDIEGTSLNLGNIQSVGGFAILESTVGDVVAGNVTANAFGVNIRSAANVVVGDLTGRGMTLNAVNNATVGDANSGVGLSFNVGNDLVTGDLDAQSMGITVGGDADIASATSNGLLTLTADGALTGGAFTAASLNRLTAASVDIDSADSTTQSLTVVATGGDAVIGSTNSQVNTVVTATGDVTVDNATSVLSVTLRGDNVALNTGNVGRTLTLDATDGDVSGTGTVIVGGAINLDATGNIGFGSLDAQGSTFNADAAGNITFDAATAATTMTMNAGGDITFNSAGSGGNMALDADGNILGGSIDTAGTGDTTFTAGSAVELDDIVSRILTVSAGTDLTIGDVNAIGRDIRGIAINLDAVGTATFGTLTSGRGIDVDAGVINGGNVISDDGVFFTADSVTLGDVAVTVIGAVTIDALAGDIVTGDLTSDTFGIFLDATGSITADNLLVNGTSNSSDIDVIAGGDADIGDVSAGNRLIIDVGGNLTAGNLSSIVVSPATLVTVGGDADIASFDATAGAGTITVDGALTGGAFTAESVLTINAGSVNIGSANSDNQTVTVDANIGDAIIGSTSSARDTLITAVGLAQVGNAVSGENFTIRGANAVVNSGTIADDLVIEATAGNIDGTGAITVGGAIDLDATGNIGFGSLEAQNGNFTADAGGTIDFTAATASGNILFNTNGAINGGDLIAGGTLDLDGGNIAVGDASGTSIAFTSAANILFDSISSPNAITLSALNGTIGANTGNGDIDSDLDVTLTAEEIAVGDVTSGGSVTANATAGDASFGTVDAANDITITATGNPSLVNAISGGNTTITGAAVTFNNGTIGGDLSLTATTGNIDGSGTVTVVGGITMDAAGNANFGSLDAQGGDFIVDAGGEIGFANASASGNVDFNAGGNIGGGNISADGTVDIDGTEIDVAAISGTDVTIDGRDIVFGTVTSSGTASLRAIETLRGGTIDAGTSAVLRGDDGITIDGATAGTNFDISTAAIFSVGNAGLNAGTDIVVDAVVADLGNSAADGSISVTATEINFGSLTAGTTITLDAIDPTFASSPFAEFGDINGGTVTAGLGASSITSFRNTALTGPIVIAGSLQMDAGNNLTFTTADVQGGDFLATAGGDLTFTSAIASGLLDFLADGNLTGTGDVNGGTGVLLESENGSVAVNDVISGGDTSLAAGTTVAVNDITLTDDDITIVAGGDVSLRDVIAARNISISSDGAITVRDLAARLTATLAAVNAISGTSIDAGLDIDLASTGGAVTVTDVSAGGDALIDGAQGVTINDLSGNTVTLNAADGAVSVAGNVSSPGLVTASGQSVFLRAADDLTVNATATAGTIDISVGGGLDVQGASAAGDITLVSGGSTTVNAAVGATTTGLPSGVQGTQQITTTNGGNISITSGADIVINSAVNAAGDLTMDAAALIDLQATASGATITTNSADMNIGTSGALGRSDATSDIEINTDGDILLGGAFDPNVATFTIDNDEFSRIHSGGDLAIIANAGAAGGSDITVRELDIAVAAGTGTPTDGNIAAFGGFFLDATGSVAITGDATMTGAGPDTFFGINAVDAITIDVDAGNLRMEDAAGALAGILDLTASTVTAISAAAEADIAGASVADIDIRLGQVDSARPDGYIQADSVTINADDTVLIQNSGTGTDFNDRAGITANDLSINAADPDAAIVVNGVVAGNLGIDAIAVTGVPSAFNGASTINGCLIADPASCAPTVVTPPVTPGGPNNPTISDNGPLRDLIDTQVDPETPLPDAASSMIIEFRQNPESQRDPLIDEPVTGAGNDDLWIGEDECAPGDAECFGGQELEAAE